MNKTIGILAHVDAGKTTFAEQILYHTKSIKQRGRVDHKDTFLDNHDIEKQRGITIFSEQGLISYKGYNYFLIDTPGHVDFAPEMERSIQVMDYAIIIISAVEGIEGHTETVWQLLQKYNIPTFFFINKVDRIGADVEEVLEEIRINLTQDACDINESFNNGKLNKELIEFIAERDEVLLETYVEEGYKEGLWLNTMQSMIKENKIFPWSKGSALQDIGIMDFFENVHLLTITDYSNDEPFSGRAFKIRYDDNGTRITHIKALSGTLKVRDEVSCGDAENRVCEKVTQIRIYNGRKFQTVDCVKAGEIFAVTGLSETSAGDGLGTLKEKSIYNMIPTLRAKVMFNTELNPKYILKIFKILDGEDSSLNVIWNEVLQEIHISVMGTIQLEVLEKLVEERFGYKVFFGDPEVLYKETINEVVEGYGHFEPLGHYAEVHLKIEPSSRNSGINFKNVCHADHLTVGHQNLVRNHIYERTHHGLLTGSSLTDLKITLLTGRAHNKHTSGGDFREATYRAIRQGLEKVRSIILEPYYDFKIKVDLGDMGRVISDIQNLYGKFDSPKTIDNKVVITGKAPVSTFMNYSQELASFTKGKGVINLVFGGYDKCHNEETVITRISYNKDADPLYTSSSIFCSKGKGYSVVWNEVEDKMHCL